MSNDDEIQQRLQGIVTALQHRNTALQAIADTIRSSGNCRWVGLYDVDHAAAVVRNIVFSGPGSPEYPTFPITKGLTGRLWHRNAP
jgi:hypothetical protein